jgi:DNA-binding Xre family transcriptional regulator
MSALDLAQYVQSRTKALGLSVKEAANYSGISRQTWHKLMVADIREAKLSTLMAVATTLKTTTPDLLAIYFQSPHRACGTIWSETPPPFI